jgi:F-type H+-transporting ATPase subunit delta
MFSPDRWALAFISACGPDADQGLAALKGIAPCLPQMHGVVSGRTAAARLERMLHAAMEQSGVNDRGTEFAVRLVVLLIRKYLFKHINTLIDEVENQLDKQNGVLHAVLESAFPPDAAFQKSLRDQLKGRFGVRDVKVQIRVAPELLSGCRLRIGSESWDASLRGQLQKMVTDIGAADIPGGSQAPGGGF